MPLSSIPRAGLGATPLTILMGFLTVAALVNPVNPRSSSASSTPWHSPATANEPSVVSPQTLLLFVNNVGDGPDVNIGDGICDAGGGACTLRAAIQESNGVAGDDTIALAPFPPPSNIILSTALPAIADNLTMPVSGRWPATAVRRRRTRCW